MHDQPEHPTDRLSEQGRMNDKIEETDVTEFNLPDVDAYEAHQAARIAAGVEQVYRTLDGAPLSPGEQWTFVSCADIAALSEAERARLGLDEWHTICLTNGESIPKQ